YFCTPICVSKAAVHLPVMSGAANTDARNPAATTANATASLCRVIGDTFLAWPGSSGRHAATTLAPREDGCPIHLWENSHTDPVCQPAGKYEETTTVAKAVGLARYFCWLSGVSS